MKNIPVQEPFHTIDDTILNFIRYDNKVLLIKPDKTGTDVDFNTGGTDCLLCSLTGYIHKGFEANYRWFKPDWWYKRTNWYSDIDYYSEKLFFLTRQYERKVKPSKMNVAKLNRYIGEFESYAIPVDKILNRIIKKASKETGLRLKLDFDDLRYNLHWRESYIPIKVGINEKYILTWENCD